MTQPPPSPTPRARVLSNLHLPAATGFSLRTFGDYPAPGASPETWRAEMERRDLAAILPLIPASERPDMVVCASPEYLPIPRDIHAFPGTKILLITDWNVCLRFLPDLLPLFDFAFVDWPGYRLLRRAGFTNVHHQPLFGHDPGDFRDLALPRTLDVSFCGNLNSGLHGERNRLAARLALWAARSDRPVHLRQAFGPAYVEVLNRSRLVFNYSVRGEANMRLFEAMACGAVPLVEESNQEVAILFQEGRHYFRYAPGRLEVTVEALLARPERLAEAAEAARGEVARHTKARQLETLLATVGREAPGRPTGSTPLPSPASRRTLVKIRILGMGYTAKEALGEIQSAAAELPGLDLEALPGLLFALLEREEGPVVPAVRKALGQLHARGLPTFLQGYLDLAMARQAGDWSAVPGLAEACRRALEAAAPEVARPGGILYATLLPPVDLGKGLNSDLNRAFLADLTDATEPGSGSEVFSNRPRDAGGAGRSLLLRHCAFAAAEAELHQGRAAEALAAASTLAAVPPAASIPLLRLMLAAAAAAGDAEATRRIGRDWLVESPLDTEAWKALIDAYRKTGNRLAMISLLEDILLLSRYFLSPAQTAEISAVLEGERRTEV